MSDSNKSNANLKHELAKLKEETNTLQKKLAMSNSAFLNIVGKSLDGIIIVDENKMVVYTNYAAINLFDKKITDLLGEPLDIDLDLNSKNRLRDHISEVNIPKPNGECSIAEVSILRAEWNNEPCSVVSFRDITERKKTEKLLEYMSHHDYLTDLPNRVFFEKNLKSTIESAKKMKHHMALLYLDLDNFKMVNDTLGHDIGDLLLKEVSQILESSIREGSDTIARLGGDEFAIILGNLRRPDYAALVARNILDMLGKTFDLAGREVFTNASIGIAVYPMAGEDSIKLIKHADLAMYNAKHHGKNQYRFYTEELNQKNEYMLAIANGLRNVIHNQELFLTYQPIIDLKTDCCCGVEALIRWQHPDLGLIPPDHFLACAEETDKMMAIGRWVFEQAISDYKVLESQGLNYLTINMSTNELDGAKTADLILSLVNEMKIDTNKLVIELTETSVMRNPNEAIKKLTNLSDLGFKVAIDDFGTGYSSLSYLKRLPISILKIDRSFIEDIGKDENNTIIVKSTIQLAHNLGLMVVAEGVETKDQLEFLKENKCDLAQGFYFSKPLVLSDLKDFLSSKPEK